MMFQVSPGLWNDFLARFPDAHILQWETWGQLKSEFGWQTIRVLTDDDAITSDGGAQILFRRLPLGLSLAYIPKGPVGTDWERLWPKVDLICKEKHSIFLKVEPDLWESDPEIDEQDRPPLGFQISSHEIQPPRTLIIDISVSEEQILARMKQKTRYNINLARRKGVVIRETADINKFYEMMLVTSERDVFGVHSKSYYTRALDLFAPRGNCALFCAEFEGQPLAGLMVFSNGKRAWYFYGASSNQHRHLMPTYLLQWKAIQWAKSQGCTLYDLWGVPDEPSEILEVGILKT